MTLYYQVHLNCRKHVFILSKGVSDKKWKAIKSSVVAAEQKNDFILTTRTFFYIISINLKPGDDKNK